MKVLYLVRHAKSSWADFSIQDFDRPLNERGKRDAPLMAQRLLDKGCRIDAFISSPAKRARKTAEHFAKVYGRDKSTIIYHDELYLASPATFAEVIGKTNEFHEHIAVFSHNNGITDFANVLTEMRIDEMPTCSIFAVSADTNDWREFMNVRKEFLFFDYPKSQP